MIQFGSSCRVVLCRLLYLTLSIRIASLRLAANKALGPASNVQIVAAFNLFGNSSVRGCDSLT
jgi:hypothetical protein